MQVDKKENDNAKVFRSFNPIRNNKPIFSFALSKFDFGIQPNLNYCTLTKWSIDPTCNENIVNRLFEEQINFKQKHISFDKERTYEGKILVSQIDCTVIDGASEVQSLGLVDIYDIPPIDTWFYLTRNKESRLLFAWIPGEFEHYANEAVLVNCVDCVNWFEQCYSEDYKNIRANTQTKSI